MLTQPTRRGFCLGTMAFAASPVLSFLPAPAPSPDSEILDAVASWLRLESVLTDLQRRRDAAFDASFASMGGDCPMDDAAGNRDWHDRWSLTECGRLEWAWDEVAAEADRHMTLAVNTPAKTSEGVKAKIRLYRASCEYFLEGDEYMMARIEDDIAALSDGVV
jgi:hypothetical protein